VHVFNQGVLIYESTHAEFILDTPRSLGEDCGSPGTAKSPSVKLRDTEEMHTPHAKSGAECTALRRYLAQSCKEKIKRKHEMTM